jgi:O-antigen ligase
MSPLLGNGLGSTEFWVERSSTHNSYVMLLSDFGLVGLLPIPALLLATVSGTRARLIPERWAFVVAILFACSFSHGVLYDYYFLIGFAVMAAMCRPSAVKSPAGVMTGKGQLSLPTSFQT